MRNSQSLRSYHRDCWWLRLQKEDTILSRAEGFNLFKDRGAERWLFIEVGSTNHLKFILVYASNKVSATLSECTVMPC